MKQAWQVSNSPSCSRDCEEMEREPLATDDNLSGKSQEEKEKEKTKEQIHQFSKHKEPPEVLICETRSKSQFRNVCGGGEGKCECKDVLSTDSSPCSWVHCSNTLTPAGGLVEHLTPETHKQEASSHPEETQEGHFVDRSIHPVQQKEVKELIENVDIDAAPDKPKDSSSSAADGKESPTGGQLKEYTSSSSSLLTSRDGTKKSSASTKRALFAHMHLNASTSTSSPQTLSPIPHGELSSPLHPSSMFSGPPEPPLSISSSSTSTCAAPQTAASPLRVPTPGQSLGSDSSEPTCSSADSSVQSQACPLKNQLSAKSLSVKDTGLVFNQHPTQPGGSSSLLSHLPLHSQQPCRTPTLLISIGGIHMIQPRSTLPLYDLVSRRTDPSLPHGQIAVTVPQRAGAAQQPGRSTES
ncbi:putative protein TPRXL isoform X2 [Austrofundulus limnaeus]|uniref:C2H2-type domain-containing protein n=1 Tax=Austrofundulus limnaeus TaxID=52670 RepID=A0A2I4D6N9_AUSLI|nr:PREDICTED: putative protein TPRXL isoform X2 [Austrofundulus limnaeus]